MSKMEGKITESEDFVKLEMDGEGKNMIKSERSIDFGLEFLKNRIKIHKKMFEKRGFGLNL